VKTYKETFFILMAVLCIVMGVLCPSVIHAGDCEEWVAKIVSVQGEVQAKKTGATQWMPVKLNDTFCPGDMLRVQHRSRAGIILSNESVTRLDQNTSVTFKGVDEKKVSFIDILKGAAHFFSRVPRSLKFSTPFVNGAVEGTEFFVQVGDDQTLISVFRGRVSAANDAGSLILASGQSAMARSGEAPASHLVVNPRDAVKWAVYYPAVIDYKAADFEGSDDAWQGKVRKSIRFYREGDLKNAFSSLDGVPDNISDGRFFTYRAGLLLTVGCVDEADSDINKALRIDTANSNALALQAIIAVAHNRKEEALDLANRAVAQDTRSSAARVALSYAQQAGFNVQGALQSLQEAVNLSPEDALAHARLSELWMSVGDLDRARVAAQKGAALNPNLSRIQTVLGFAYLAQIEIEYAKSTFEQAIALDSAAPLPRLGLGLAKIREGDLKPGRTEIEIAAGLDPNSSLIRSYLGKAFFDEKRDKQSNSQLAIAKELDPNDPTPWFYDAIRKQTLNRPVEALHDLQKSIELNDNRAVYRSRMLLDEDLAARSASLGRIYNDLGFQQLALVEGWKSVNTSPASYSAHRFLADSYSSQPWHEIARVSELLQSQLLQPINVTPVQPHLAESESLILEGTGPAVTSYNEFNPLFLRNRLALQASGVVGGNDIYGDEVVQSGVWGRTSYSVGQFHYQTDGVRTNNDFEENIYNAFVQTSLTHKTSVQAEYRYKHIEKGDLPIKFDPDDFFDTLRENERSRSIRLGAHHAFSPHSDLIASFIYNDFEEDIDFPTDGLEFDGDCYSGEIQHLFHSDRISLTSGVGHFDQDVEEVSSSLFFGVTTEEHDMSSTNLYVYTFINYPKNFAWTVGGSVDFYKGTLKDRDQFNPKFGVTWNPFPATTIRGAVFRTLSRDFNIEMTLEPTQVSGFNQFFEDSGGTDSWRYGVAVDQRFSDNIFGGVEVAWRDIEFPFEFTDFITFSTEIRTADWETDMARGYLYWTPHRWLTLSAEYRFEQLDRDLDSPGWGNELDLETHKIPLGIGFYHPLGFSARIKATYIDQDGEFSEWVFPTPPPFPPPPPYQVIVPGDDQFWVVDAAIEYRLPRRYGIITLEARNLFNEEFQFQDSDPRNPRISPESLILARFTLAY